MYQILIGKSTNGGPSSFFFHKSLDVESINYSDLTSEIREGLQSVSNLMLDSTIIDALASTELVSSVDLKCLIWHLKQQNISLLVTKVGSDVIDASTDLLVKVITPFNDSFGISKSIDYPFTGIIDMVDVINSLASSYTFFNPSLFIESPISEILSQIKNAKIANIPTDELVNKAVDILNELGFNIIAAYING